MTVPNRSPIYTGEIFLWSTRLVTVATPRIITTTLPTLIGTSGDCGALIYHVRTNGLGNDVATILRLYYKRNTGSDLNYYLFLETDLPVLTGTTDTASIAEVTSTLPLLPLFGASVRGLHVPPDTSVYAGLGTAVSIGKSVHVTGGYYKLQS